MHHTVPFTLPPTKQGEPTPCWTGNGFLIGQELTDVLQYSVNHAGWNDELTLFHEEAAGDQHFMDRASRALAVQQLKKNIRHKNPVILEIGCSSGFMLRRLCKDFPDATIMGADVIYGPLSKLAQTLSGVPLFRFDMLHCPLPDNSIDAVVILNVLEHIDDDAAALRQIYRILKPGGTVIIEVPAGPHLYDSYDKVLMHFRRYALSGLTQLVMQQGFSIAKKSHLGFFVYPGFFLVKKNNLRFMNDSPAIQQRSTEKQIHKTAKNKFFHALMQLELFVGKMISYPVGIRCTLSCVKPMQNNQSIVPR